MDVVTPFEDALKKYDSENHTEKSRESEVGQFVYSIHLLLSDDSLAGEVCNAYIYTYDQKGLEFLPELNPANIFGRNTLNIKENYDNFVNRLVEESDVNDTPIEVVLSPLFNGKETIYRIVSTELLF